MTSNDEHTQHAPADDDIDVVVIDPAEVMPAEEALRNYGIAEDAVGRFVQLAGEGWADDDAAARAVEASDDATGLAADAVAEYRRRRGDGLGNEAAHRAAVVDMADHYTPRVSAETAQQIAAAFGEPAAEPTDAHDDAAELSAADLAAALPYLTTVGNYNRAHDALTVYERELTAGTDPDSARRAAVASRPEHRELVELAIERYERGHVGERDLNRAALDTAEQLRQRTVDAEFGEEDEVDDTAADSATGGGTGFELGEVVRDRQTGEVFTVTGNAAGWDPSDYETVENAPGPEVPERAPQPGSWIARNLSGPARSTVDAELARVQAAVNALPAGVVTDADLARVGIDRDEFNRVTREAENRVRAEEQAQRDAERRGLIGPPHSSSMAAAEGDTALVTTVAEHVAECGNESGTCGMCNDWHDGESARQLRADTDTDESAARDGALGEAREPTVEEWMQRGDEIAARFEQEVELWDEDTAAESTVRAFPEETHYAAIVVGQRLERLGLRPPGYADAHGPTSWVEYLTNRAEAAKARAAQQNGGRSATDVSPASSDETRADEGGESAPLGKAVMECGRAVSAAEHAARQADAAGEDSARAERCARWNADDQTAEATDDAWSRE